MIFLQPCHVYLHQLGRKFVLSEAACWKISLRWVRRLKMYAGVPQNESKLSKEKGKKSQGL